MSNCKKISKLHKITLKTSDIYYEIAQLCAISAEGLDTQNVKLKRNLTDATTSNNRDIVYRLINDALSQLRLDISNVTNIETASDYDDDRDTYIYIRHSDAIDDNTITSLMHSYIVYYTASSLVATTTINQATISYAQLAADNLLTLKTYLYNDVETERDIIY